MQTRRLNVSTGAGGVVTIKRNRFDSHLDHCDRCSRGDLCPTAQQLWRGVLLEAQRKQQVAS